MIAVTGPRAVPLRRPALEPPTVSGETILRFQKYRDLGRVPRAIRDAADAAATEATRLAAPQAVLWRGEVTGMSPTGLVILAGSHRLHSLALARLLDPCREAVVFVLTAGPAIERRTREMLDEKLLVEGFLMDVAAWAVIETLARGLRRRLLEEERGAGGGLTHRLGPGHCDWPVEEQGALLAVFGDAPLPVTVNEAACLSPCKSITGVFGVIPSGRG